MWVFKNFDIFCSQFLYLKKDIRVTYYHYNYCIKNTNCFLILVIYKTTITSSLL